MSLDNVWLFASGIFILAAACYMLILTSGPLERTGRRLGKLLHLPEDVIASTLQAAATSGPEIVMAILAATPFVAQEVWKGLELGEKASSGCLNMAFSAMHNLIGIGCMAMIGMILWRNVKPNEIIVVKPSTKIGLIFYIISSGCLYLFVLDGILTETESWVLMIVGIVFILSQLIIPTAIKHNEHNSNNADDENDPDEDPEDEACNPPIPTKFTGWSVDLLKTGFTYAFLVFALIVFVRESLNATFNMATVGLVSVGGVLILFTSYVSSFPEFMMAFRYARAAKKGALLGMLFGSNVIDLSFAGFRAMWLHEPMAIYTTGLFPHLLPYYILALPVIALLALVLLWLKRLRYSITYPIMVFYVVYILSGFVLL